MKNDSLKIIFRTFILVSLFSCSNNQTSDSTQDETNSQSNSEENSPTASFPTLPSLTAPQVVAYNGNTLGDGFIPVVGTVDSTYSGYYFVVSTEELNTTTFTTQTNQCDALSLSHALIDSSGWFEPLYLVGTEQTTLYYYITDCVDHWGDSVNDTPRSNLLWNVSATQDTAQASQKVYALNGSSLLKMEYSSTQDLWSVLGSHEDGYQVIENSGASQLAFDSTNSNFGLLKDSTGILVKQLSGTDESITSLTTISLAAANAYKVIKSTNDSLYFGIEQEKAFDAFIYNYLNYIQSSANTSLLGATEESHIQFIECDEEVFQCTDKDSSGNRMDYTTLQAFDIQTIAAEPYLLVAYQDSQSLSHLRMANEKSTIRFGGETAMGSYAGLKELIIYHTPSLTSETGYAALLDSTNNKVWIVKFNIAAQTITFNTGLFVSVGHNPQAMLLSQHYLYVTNSEDDTISVIKLFDDSNSPLVQPTVEQTINLDDLVTDKTLTLNPSGILEKDGYLMISCTGIKGQLILKLSDL